jgi:hypothetical protein
VSAWRARGAIASCLAGVALVAGGSSGVSGAGADQASAAHPRAAAEIAAYWTAARMRAAPPLRIALPAPPPGPGAPAVGSAPSFVPPAGAGAGGAALRSGGGDAAASAFDPGDERTLPNRLHGRVFATYPSTGDYTCSATAVNSPGRSLVVSAGHCVFDPPTGQWASNWTFVPGYRQGRAPFGRWVARRLDAADPWVKQENISFDVGTAVVVRNRRGRALQDVIGGRGIGFNQPRDQLYVSYGYPAEIPFDGERLKACRSRYRGDDPETDPPRTMRIRCDMSAGSSGGGWVSNDLVLSLNSYCVGLVLICIDNESMYGPYFGNGAKELYLRSRGKSPPLCAGRRATQLGGSGPQTFAGRSGPDTIVLRGGSDRGSGRGGPDHLCGGGGADVLRGGRGFDVCVGGPGTDRAFGCERRRRIP